jgi:hypothetical protein
MRDLGSAVDQPWAVPEASGDIGVAADPRSAVTNGQTFGLSGCYVPFLRFGIGCIFEQ